MRFAASSGSCRSRTRFPRAGPHSPFPAKEARVALAEVRRAYLSLSEEHREVLLLVAIEGLQYEEAADILRVPLGTVRSGVPGAPVLVRRWMRGWG